MEKERTLDSSKGLHVSDGLHLSNGLQLSNRYLMASTLAFGLGCKDLARDAAARFLQNLREKRRTDSRPDLEG